MEETNTARIGEYAGYGGGDIVVAGEIVNGE
jgi:hypothetical protein